MNNTTSYDPAPWMIITCGLTGTGKSTIIKEIAKEKGFAVFASDAIRKQLVGIQPEEHRYEEFHEGIYSKEFTEKTYVQMIEEGKEHLKQGKSVVLDACFPKRWQRERAFESAKEANAKFLCIEFICPEQEVRKRLTKRFESKEGISDGRWEIYQSQKMSFEAVDELSLENHLVVDTSEPLHESINKIKRRLES